MRKRREHEEQDRGRHPGPADRDPAADPDPARHNGSPEGADRIGDPVREDLDGGIDPAKDAVRDDALDERQLGDALDRLEAVDPG